MSRCRGAGPEHARAEWGLPCQQIRTLKPDQLVIILTGASTPEKEQQVRTLGVNEFVEKEFSLHRLGDALKRLLNPPVPAG